jgi:hypothetical protein
MRFEFSKERVVFIHVEDEDENEKEEEWRILSRFKPNNVFSLGLKLGWGGERKIFCFFAIFLKLFTGFAV